MCVRETEKERDRQRWVSVKIASLKGLCKTGPVMLMPPDRWPQLPPKAVRCPSPARTMVLLLSVSDEPKGDSEKLLK